MSIGEMVEMWIKRINRLSLARDYDDQPLAGNPTQLRDGRTEIKDVLYHVGAYDGVEFIVTKRESFNFGFNKSYARGRI